MLYKNQAIYSRKNTVKGVTTESYTECCQCQYIKARDMYHNCHLLLKKKNTDWDRVTQELGFF